MCPPFFLGTSQCMCFIGWLHHCFATIPHSGVLLHIVLTFPLMPTGPRGKGQALALDPPADAAAGNVMYDSRFSTGGRSQISHSVVTSTVGATAPSDHAAQLSCCLALVTMPCSAKPCSALKISYRVMPFCLLFQGMHHHMFAAVRGGVLANMEGLLLNQVATTMPQVVRGRHSLFAQGRTAAPAACWYVFARRVEDD